MSGTSIFDSVVSGPLAPLPSQYQLVILSHHQTVTIRVLGWLAGTMTIHPRGSTSPMTIDALGLHVERLDRPSAHPWWAITAKTLIADLLPWLVNPQTAEGTITIAAYGYATRRSYVVTHAPGSGGQTS